MPSTGSWSVWRNSSVSLPLSAGEHTIEIRVKNPGFNFNWISILEGNNPSNAELTTALVHSSGLLFYMFYDRRIEVLPQVSEITLTADGEQIPISSIAYYLNDTARLVFELDSIIYKDQEVLLSYSVTSAVTTELGVLEPVSEYDVVNSSREVKVGISEFAQNTINLYPIPARVGEIITLLSNSGGLCKYEIFNASGMCVEQGSYFDAHTCIVLIPGIYLVRITCGDVSDEFIMPVK